MRPANSNTFWASIFRTIARVGSIASTFVLMAFIFGGNERLPHGQEWLGLALFPGGILLGMVWGWKSELVGGLITVLSLIGFYALQLIISGRVPGGPWFVLFASPGIFFLLSCAAQRMLDKKDDVG